VCNKFVSIIGLSVDTTNIYTSGGELNTKS